MAKTEIILGEVGGKEPFVVLDRGNSGYVDTYIANNDAKKYKYVKLMTSAEYTTYSGDSDVAAYINTTSATLRIDNDSSKTFALSTTPKLISELNLTDNKSSTLRIGSLSAWTGYAAMFYND